MSDLERPERFPRTDPNNVGWDEAMAVLQVYVDLASAGQDTAERDPGVAAHVVAWSPCGEDFTGLLLAVANG